MKFLGPNAHFIEDAILFCRMWYSHDPRIQPDGERLQRRMVNQYPSDWMYWLFQEVGYFADDELMGIWMPGSVEEVMKYKTKIREAQNAEADVSD